MFFFGLGNPGDRYKNTRHNIGFSCIDILIKYLKIDPDNLINYYKIFNSEVYEVTHQKKEIIYLIKPQGYMNLSGKFIRLFANEYKLKKNEIHVFYDDIAITLGRIKIKEKGSSGGHRGIQSIIDEIGNEFIRIRIGIGTTLKVDLKNWVLQDFNASENKILDNIWKEIIEIYKIIITNKKNTIQNLMNQFNGKEFL